MSGEQLRCEFCEGPEVWTLIEGETYTHCERECDRFLASLDVVMDGRTALFVQRELFRDSSVHLCTGEDTTDLTRRVRADPSSF